jgi:predicted phosphoribosyltransferase
VASDWGPHETFGSRRELAVVSPTGAPAVCASFERSVDRVICAQTPTPFVAVGASYEEFVQTGDDEVRRLLQKAGVAAGLRRRLGAHEG